MTFKSGRGGPGRGQGRKKGITFTDRTERLYERITPTEKAQLEQYLRTLRTQAKEDSYEVEKV